MLASSVAHESPRDVDHPGSSAKGAPEAKTGFYRPELDGLRFFAFLAVFWSHAAPREPGPWMKIAGTSGTPWIIASVVAGGWGVDLFFALSSYLITELLLQEKAQQGRIAVGAFWVRRALRIWPLYIAFYLAALFVIPHLIVDRLEGGYALAFGTFTANWALAAWGMVPSCVGPLWSVSIEEQFYLVWPLITRSLSRVRLGVLCGALIPVAIGVRAYLIMRTGDAFGFPVWCNTFARLDPIALGALLAVVLRQRKPDLSPAAARGLLALAAVVLVITTRAEPAVAARPLLGSLVYTVNAVACTAALVGTLALGRVKGGLLARPTMVYLGRISYGLYVFHVFAIRVIAQLRGERASLAMHALMPLCSFALTLALAAASYRWLEAPFLRWKQRFSRIGKTPRT